MIKKYKENEIDELAKILINDGVICVPTDTVYGICAKMKSKKAHDNLIKIKNRPLNKLFPIMCADEEQIKDIAYIDTRIAKLIHTFMPGPITLVLRKKEGLSEYINNGSETIAIRMATSKILYDMIKKIDSPIFMTSANKSGEETCKSIEEIERVFPTIDGVLVDDLPKGKASTIIDCTSEDIRIIREGPISLDQVKEALNS